MLAGVTPTAGGLVFTGDLEGNLFAFDAKTGTILFKTRTGNPIGGGVSVYSLAGKQYIAVASGLNSRLWLATSQTSEVVVYALPDEEMTRTAHRSR